MVESIVKQNTSEQLADRWEQRPLHGKYVTRSKRIDVFHIHIYQWLWRSGPKSGSEDLSEQY